MRRILEDKEMTHDERIRAEAKEEEREAIASELKAFCAEVACERETAFDTGVYEGIVRCITRVLSPARIKSRGASGPRCTCGVKAHWYEHADKCPCYKPPDKGCFVCRCGGSSFCRCSCHKPSEITPLEKLRDDGSYDPPIIKAINALVDAVNELQEKMK